MPLGDSLDLHKYVLCSLGYSDYQFLDVIDEKGSCRSAHEKKNARVKAYDRRLESFPEKKED